MHTWTLRTSLTIITLATTALVNSEVLPGNPRFVREVSDGVTSLGYELIYGDEDFTIVNEVVRNMDKQQVLKRKERLSETIKPLPAEDVKCLMSVDRYCSKEMGQMKSVLIQAIKEDCIKCSTKEKDEAGKVIASMMAHDPVAWKLFLTRCALLRTKNNPKKQQRSKRDQPKYKTVGEPEEIENSKNRKAIPGVKVKVKRYKTIRVS